MLRSQESRHGIGMGPPDNIHHLLRPKPTATVTYGGIAVTFAGLMTGSEVTVWLGLVLAVGCCGLIIWLHWSELTGWVKGGGYPKELTLPMVTIFAVAALVAIALARGFSFGGLPFGPPQMFSSVYSSHKKELGNSLTPASHLPNHVGSGKDRSIYQLSMERGELIWSNIFPHDQIVLTSDGENRTIFKLYRDDIRPLWFSLTYTDSATPLRDKFGYPPYAGSAKWLVEHKDLEETKSMGAMLWQCLYNGSEVLIQKFENGYILGPVRSSSSEQDGVFLTFVYGKDKNGEKTERRGIFYEEGPEVVGPKCYRPQWQK